MLHEFLWGFSSFHISDKNRPWPEWRFRLRVVAAGGWHGSQTPHVFWGDSDGGRLADSVRCHQVGREQDWSDLAGQQSLKRVEPKSNSHLRPGDKYWSAGPYFVEYDFAAVSSQSSGCGSPSGERADPSDPNRPVWGLHQGGCLIRQRVGLDCSRLLLTDSI